MSTSSEGVQEGNNVTLEGGKLVDKVECMSVLEGGAKEGRPVSKLVGNIVGILVGSVVVSASVELQV